MEKRNASQGRGQKMRVSLNTLVAVAKADSLVCEDTGRRLTVERFRQADLKTADIGGSIPRNVWYAVRSMVLEGQVEGRILCRDGSYRFSVVA